ncbi:MAG: PAS domain S-box protein [Leptolyngbyaceae cyanobacterium CSU_1_3]|nr:PAS domain S-box protein [Leptolyngbyaceae cyanobacterium CSU_1_3]
MEADTATAGLELCRTHSIDAILLDYRLPDADGLEFIELLQAQNNGSSPPVVIITGEGNERIAVRAIKLGAEDYLVKQGLTSEQLQLTMRSAIDNARLRLQLRQSEERFRVSIENMLDCFGIYSAIRDQSGQIVDFRIDYLNAAALESNRMSAADFGKGLCDLLPSHRETVLFEAYCRVVETGEPLVKEDLIYKDVFGTQNLTRAYDVHVNKLGDGFVASWRDVTNRKQVEANLAQMIEVLHSIIEGSSDVIFVKDLQGRYVIANSTAATWLESTRELMLGQDDAALFPPEISERIQQIDQQILQTGESIVYEEEVPKQGELRSLLSAKYPWRDAEGNILGVIGISRDISDRVRYERDRRLSEQRLRESEEQLQIGVQVAGVALAHFDYASNMVTLSPEAATLYGIDELTVTRDRLHATFHPDEQAMMAQIIAQVIDPAGDSWFARDHRVVWQNGEVRWLSVRKQVFFDRSGEIPRPDYAILAAIDITDRKQLQEALYQSEERLRLIADTIPLIVWTTDPYGNYGDTDYVNQRWTEYTGLTAEQATAYGWQNLIYSEDLPAVQAFWSEACETALLYEIEYRLRRADGMYRWHLVKGLPLRNEQGQVIKWIGTCTDIHNQKQSEAERAQWLAEAEAAREEAEAANQSKDEFVAVVAHELRSPLNSIAGWSKLLQSRKFDEATLSKALDTIWRNTQAQVQLVEDLLDISRMVKGTLQINFAPVNWVDVIEAALDIVRPMAEAKQIQLDTHLSFTPHISGDFNRLQQIAVNLLTNAVKFTPESGRVEVHLEQVDAYVVLRVQDTGKGIASEFLPQIFERYKQGQRNTGSKDGLGLGLAIVKNLVELHHGTITAESAGLGAGATFTVQMPRLEIPVIQRESLVIDPNSLTGIRILAVDDDPDMLNLIAFVLQDFGADVKAVTTAAAALECLSQFKPNILVSDLAMPGEMDMNWCSR